MKKENILRWIALALAAIMILSSAACGKGGKPTLAGTAEEIMKAEKVRIEGELVIEQRYDSIKATIPVSGTVDRKNREFSLTLGCSLKAPEDMTGYYTEQRYDTTSYLLRHKGDILTVTLKDGVLSLDLSGAMKGYRSLAEFLLADGAGGLIMGSHTNPDTIMAGLEETDLDDLERLTAVYLFSREPWGWDRDIRNVVDAMEDYPEDMDLIRDFVLDFEDALGITLKDLLKITGFSVEVGQFSKEAKAALDTFTDILVNLTAAAEEAAGEDVEYDAKSKEFEFVIDSGNVEDILEAVIDAALENLEDGWDSWAALCDWLRDESAVRGQILDVLEPLDDILDENWAENFEDSWDYVLEEYSGSGYKKDLKYELRDADDAVGDIRDEMKDTKSELTGTWSLTGKRGSRVGTLEGEWDGKDAEYSVRFSLTVTEDSKATVEPTGTLLSLSSQIKKIDWDFLGELIEELRDY